MIGRSAGFPADRFFDVRRCFIKGFIVFSKTVKRVPVNSSGTKKGAARIASCRLICLVLPVIGSLLRFIQFGFFSMSGRRTVIKINIDILVPQ